MHYSALLHVLDSDCELSNQSGNFRFTEKFGVIGFFGFERSHFLLDVLIQFLGNAMLHQQVNVLVVFKKVEQLCNVRAVI